MPVPSPIRIYRMVHKDNVQHVLMNGLCCKDHEHADPEYIAIGHSQLIKDRYEHPIPLEGAGDLGAYIPFYFAGHSPMLYLIMNGYQNVKQTPQDDIVFLVSDVDTVIEHELDYIFTDRNAKLATANFYDEPSGFGQLKWGIIQSSQWKNDANNLSRKDYKQAEFLVKNHMPISGIKAIVVKTEKRRLEIEKLIVNLGLDVKVYEDTTHKLYY